MERIVRIPTCAGVEFGIENRTTTGRHSFAGMPLEESVHYVRWAGESYQIAMQDMIPTELGQLAIDCNTLETVRINYAEFVESVLGKDA